MKGLKDLAAAFMWATMAASDFGEVARGTSKPLPSLKKGMGAKWWGKRTARIRMQKQSRKANRH